MTLDVMLEAAGAPGSALGAALETAITNAADQTPFARPSVPPSASATRSNDWIERAGSLDKAIEELSQALGLSPGETLDDIDERMFTESLIPQAEWPAIAAVARAGTENRPRAGRTIFRCMRERTGREQLEILLDIHCNQDARAAREHRHQGDPRSASRLWPSGCRQEQDRICALLERRRAVLCRDKTRALLTIAHAITTRYRREKDRRGLLDYDDLIDRTLALFRNTSAAWVLYKLDLGIDHILIDEAQDTSPAAMGHHPRPGRGIQRRRGRATRRAHAVRGRRRQAVDLLVPGRRSENIRGRSRTNSKPPSRARNCPGGR